MRTYHVHIEGGVQGVGFRPFVHNLAVKRNLNGSVANTLKGVHIYVNAQEDEIVEFVERLRSESPEQSVITSISLEEVAEKEFDRFAILESSPTGDPELLITPDFAMCQECRDELNDPESRRYGYPFTTCVKCGPRYSILQKLPYDRHFTTMQTFRMCPRCEAEFESSGDRRFFAQTNSCPACRISLWVVNQNGLNLDIPEGEIVSYVCEKLESGAVVAVKGIGGFLLMCDAANEQNIKKLRHQKSRPFKPFALMYPSLSRVKEHFIVSEQEENELKGTAAPIVLLERGKAQISHEVSVLVAPGLDRAGVMLPYAPLFELIAQRFGKPLLATSGNVHGAPITFKNQNALSNLHHFSDYFLLNNRKITAPQDDSVVVFTEKHKKRIVLRRSRGLAPAFLQQALNPDFHGKILAMGALLKSAFGIWSNGTCHISQFLGDTTEFESQSSYEKTIAQLMRLLQFRPQTVLIDKHPAYYSSRYGRELAGNHGAAIIEIQHHKAHFYAALGENDLIHTTSRTLGVVFDGTGLGNDGAIWGGEFFLYEQGKAVRSNHLEYYPHILGDKMAREPRLSAFSLAYSAGADFSLILPHFLPAEQDYYQKVLRSSSLCTSSVGRLFDAAASILGICQMNTFEGEAAMYLEVLAKSWCKSEGDDYPLPYEFDVLPNGAISHREIILKLIEEMHQKVDKGRIAAAFHRTIVEMVARVARKHDVKQVVFSGGVMQNTLLVDMLIDVLGNEFALFFHKNLSPNDECIAYGQLVSYYVGKTMIEKPAHPHHQHKTV